MIFYKTDDQTIKVLNPISLTNISGREVFFQVCKNGVLLVLYTRKRGKDQLWGFYASSTLEGSDAASSVTLAAGSRLTW